MRRATMLTGAFLLVVVGWGELAVAQGPFGPFPGHRPPAQPMFRPQMGMPRSGQQPYFPPPQFQPFAPRPAPFQPLPAFQFNRRPW